MKDNKMLNIINSLHIVIPFYVLKIYKKLNISELELIFIYYLKSIGDKVMLDLSKFNLDLNIDMENLMQIISALTNKKLLTMVVEKNDKGIMEEYIDISVFNDKLVSVILDEEEKQEATDIFTTFEKEFGRCLSPIEYETIAKWIDSNIDEKLIYDALKEATLNGVSNLKYIDKIIYEWMKKGYNKKDNIQEEKEELVELFDYDWLDENE